MSGYHITRNIIDGLVKELDSRHLEQEEVGFDATLAISQDASGNQIPVVQVLAIGRGVSIGEQIATKIIMHDLNPNEAHLTEVVNHILSSLEKVRQEATSEALSGTIVNR